MPAIADIKTSTIIDSTMPGYTTSATVGVDRTYSPEGFQLPGVARWVDRSGGIQLGFPAFSLSVRPPTKASRVFKVMAKLVLPTLEETSQSTMTGIEPPPTKAYDLMAVLEVLLPERSSLAERNVLISQLLSFLLPTVMASDANPTDSTGTPLLAAIRNFDPPY